MQGGLVSYQPLIPPTITWAGLTVMHRMWPVWILLLVLSLAYLFWRMAADDQLSMNERLFWVVVIIILGPFGLLVYLLARRKKRRMASVVV